MHPALKGYDLVTFESSLKEQLHRGDLMLFRNNEGALVPRRLVRFVPAADGSRKFDARNDVQWRLDVPFLPSRLLVRARCRKCDNKIIGSGTAAAGFKRMQVAWRGPASYRAGYRIHRMRNGSNPRRKFPSLSARKDTPKGSPTGGKTPIRKAGLAPSPYPHNDVHTFNLGIRR